MKKQGDEMLLAILAKTDAVFWPLRIPEWEQGGRPRFWQARRDFFEAGGVPWQSGAAGDTEGKAIARQLDALAGRGLVWVFRPGGRTLSVKLTPEGDDLARRLIGLPTFEQSLAGLDRIFQIVDSGGVPGCSKTFKGWISEEFLSGAPWVEWERRSGCWIVLLEDLYPLIVRALLEGASSLNGCCWYKLTPAGLALATERKSKNLRAPWPPKIPKHDEAGFACYRKMRREAINTILESEPRNASELGLRALPVSWRAYEKPTPERSRG